MSGGLDFTSSPPDRESTILANILKVGLDFPEISRRSGIPVETVRYLYKHRILKSRMYVQRELEHYKLGLSHIQFVVSFDRELEPLFHSDSLLTRIWGEVYANTVYRIVPESQFFLDHLAPPSFHPRLREFYSRLEDIGAVKVHQSYNCSRLIHSRMWVEDYNWDLPGWDFDWASLKPPRNIQDPPPGEPVKFDKTDLLMVEQFQIGFGRSVAEVAAKCGLERTAAYWHFRKHVDGRGLFGNYRINWLGTQRDSKTGGASTRQSFAGIKFIAKDLSLAEMMGVRASLHSIPYLWSEQVGESDIGAETFVPVHSLTEAFEFFGRILRPLEGRARILTIDQTGAANFTINPALFDAGSKKWVFNGDAALEGARAALAGRSPDPTWKEKDRERAF